MKQEDFLPEDYGIVQMAKDHWEIYKFDESHTRHLATYNVTMAYGNMYCDCPAAKANCKHQMMVNQYRLYMNMPSTKPKKDLF